LVTTDLNDEVSTVPESIAFRATLTGKDSTDEAGMTTIPKSIACHATLAGTDSTDDYN
jgi:hypothetical protein